MNAQSIRNKKLSLENIIAGFSELPILCICETWLCCNDSNVLFPFCNNYVIYRSERERGHGGVALMIPKNIPSMAVYKLMQCDDFESVWCRLVLKSSKIDIGMFYRPPRPSKQSMPKILLDYISKGVNPAIPTIIVGDFNYPGIDWLNCAASHQNGQHLFFEFMNENGFSQLVNFPTRNTNTLDLIFTNEPNLIQCVELGQKISDHETINSLLTIQRIAFEKIYYRDFKNGNFDAIQDVLASTNWVSFFADCLSTNDKWIAFEQFISSLIVSHVPLRTIINNQSSCSSNVKKLCRKTWKLHKLWKKNRTPESYAKYLDASKLSQRAKRAEIYNREHKVLQSANMDTFWKYINSKLTYKSPLPCLLDSNNSIVSDDMGKANLLNKYFSSVFTQDDNISRNWNIEPPDSDCSEISTTPVQVYEKLKKLAPKMSCGPDDIPPFFLNRLASVICTPLSIIFNCSLQERKIAEQWREAHVNSLFKQGNPNLGINYRPISLTCASCRVLESFIADSVKNFLTDVVFEGQHGFLTKKSTVTQLFESYEDWTLELDKNKSIDIVYIDFAKAFDTVSHCKLISKLKAYRLSDQLIDWITDYLSNRSQRVKVGSKLSDKCSVISGVPQGSVLGPLLFLIFINDLPKCIRDCIVKLFADDCKLYIAFSSPLLLLNPLQIALNSLSVWAGCSQLIIQPTKSAILHVGRKNPSFDYQLDNESIPSVETIRDLGVIMNKTLTFDQHIESIVKSAIVKANLILRVFKTRKHSFMIQMFNTFVRPRLEYACQIWNPHNLNLINKIEKVQRNFTKRLPLIKNLPYPNRLDFLNIDSLELRRLHLDLVFVYKLLHGHFNVDASKYFTFKTSRTRGNSWALVKKHSNKDVRKYAFSQRIINIWNFLPDTSVNAMTVPSFKISLHDIDFNRFLRGQGLDV